MVCNPPFTLQGVVGGCLTGHPLRNLPNLPNRRCEWDSKFLPNDLCLTDFVPSFPSVGSIPAKPFATRRTRKGLGFGHEHYVKFEPTIVLCAPSYWCAEDAVCRTNDARKHVVEPRDALQVNIWVVNAIIVAVRHCEIDFLTLGFEYPDRFVLGASQPYFEGNPISSMFVIH